MASALSWEVELLPLEPPFSSVEELRLGQEILPQAVRMLVGVAEVEASCAYRPWALAASFACLPYA